MDLLDTQQGIGEIGQAGYPHIFENKALLQGSFIMADMQEAHRGKFLLKITYQYLTA